MKSLGAKDDKLDKKKTKKNLKRKKEKNINKKLTTTKDTPELLWILKKQHVLLQ